MTLHGIGYYCYVDGLLDVGLFLALVSCDCASSLKSDL